MKFRGTDIVVWGANGVAGTAGFEELYQGDQALDWYAVLETGAALDITSSSANDVATTGTGLRTLTIYGLGTDKKYQEETIAMNGTTIVNSTKSWTDIFGAQGATYGTLKRNDGVIYMVKTGTGGTYTTPGVPGTVTSLVVKMLATFCSCQNGHWVVPADETQKYRLEFIAYEGHTQASTLAICTQSPWSATDPSCHIESIIGIANNYSNSIDLSKFKWEIGAGEGIRVRVLGASNSANVKATILLKRV